MNIDRESVIKLAREASNNCKDALLEDHNDLAMLYLDELERFAALVAAAERDRLKSAAECFRMCEHKGVCDEKAKSNETG